MEQFYPIAVALIYVLTTWTTVNVNGENGYADISGNKTDCAEKTIILYIGISVIGIAFILLISIGIICIIYWKRNKASEKLEWKVKSVALSVTDSMKCMSATPDGMMAVGCNKGRWGIELYSADGQLQKTELQGVKVQGIGFLSDRRCAVDSVRSATDGTIFRVSLYKQDWNEVDAEEFESMKWEDDGSNDITVDSNDHIYVCQNNEKILVVPPHGGKQDREIPCNLYTPDQIFAMQSSKKVVVKDSKSALMINESGNVEQKLTRTNGSSVYPAIRKDGTILIATVNKERDGVNIKHYTNELEYLATLVKDHNIDKSVRHSYYLQEFTSGEIAFCTPDRLYIFS